MNRLMRSKGTTRGMPKLVVLVGKGGVGRSTAAAALGLCLARSGLVTAVLEVSAFQTIPRMFGIDGKGYTPVECAPNLWVSAVTWREALAEYGLIRLKLRMLYRLVFENPFMRRIVAATPGLQEILVMGKVLYVIDKGFSKGPRPDVVVVDAPATGHGKALLTTPLAVSRGVSSGPLAAETEAMRRRLLDRTHTRVHLVVTPEEMPVVEGIELARELLSHGFPVAETIVNQVEMHGLDDRQIECLETVVSDHTLPADVSHAARAALFMSRRFRNQRLHLRRMAELPWKCPVYLPWTPGEGKERIERLSDSFSSWVGREAC